MKIIMHYVESPLHAVEAYTCVDKAIEDGIKEGRNNFIVLLCPNSGNYYSISKNKSSYSVYRQRSK